MTTDCNSPDGRNAEIAERYDFIVCGSGASGSVVARRLAQNPDVSVLLLEAGGDDAVPEVMDAAQWTRNLGTERTWNFTSEPNPHLNGRQLDLAMGRALGGGSSVNTMLWAHGHKDDWEYFAAETGDPAWGYESVLSLYRRIEDWAGNPDPQYRGTGGPAFVQPAPDPSPVARAMVAAAAGVGIPTFDHQNGKMMEGRGGTAIADLRVRNGRRQSVYRSYVFPIARQPNLTIVTGALVTKITIDGAAATGVEVLREGRLHHINAAAEVIVSLGAINTPKLLMQSGIGDESELRRHGIPVVQHLPGVGRNYQDHPGFDCLWEYRTPIEPRNNGVEATYFWTSDTSLDAPDLQTCQAEFPKSSSPENTAQYHPPAGAWNLFAGLIQPKSRGDIRLTGPNPDDPVEIHANTLSHPDDLRAAVAAVELAREIGNSPALRPFVKREVMPGNLNGANLERFVKNATSTYWHQSGTAKMGRDALSVVDGRLQVNGIARLRIADGSIMPRITRGNTQAPCVVIGERAADLLRHEHGLGTAAHTDPTHPAAVR